MKQVKFNGQSFSQIIKTVEGIRGNGDVPKLAKIYYRARNGYITLQCCNGYIAVKLLFPYIGESEEFEGWFDYIAIEKDVQEVTLSQKENGDTVVSYKTDGGHVERVFPRGDIKKFDVDELYGQDRPKTIFFDPNLLIKALKAFSKNKSKVVRIHIPEAPTDSILIEDLNLQSVVMPYRGD